MKSKLLMFATATALFMASATGLRLVAQDSHPQKPSQHHHYKLIDVGTFGGSGGGIINPASGVINNRGMVIGGSDTALPDPFAPNMCFFDCSVFRGFLWSNGEVSELPTLPDGSGLSGIPSAINNRGEIVGQAQNGAIDSSTGWPVSSAVLWQEGQAIDLGNLGGTQGIANAINENGSVVGGTSNATPDPFANSPLSPCFYLPSVTFSAPGSTFAISNSFFPGTTESRAFLSRRGQMQDLGTLGGPDSSAWIINDREQVAGWSFTSFVANSSTGVPTVDPFVWSPKTGKMTDLGGFGGTCGSPEWMNNRGQVVGSSNLPGDTGSHAFLWSKGVLTDLAPAGTPFGVAFSINDAVEVVGTLENLQATGIYAFSWKNGVLKDLGTVDGDPCSQAFSINASSQIVGVSDDCATGADLHGFLVENGAPIVDLNKLIVPASNSTVVSAAFVNDGGEIGCILQLTNGDSHPCVLIPCDENHSDIEGCDFSMVDGASAVSPKKSAIRESSGQAPARPQRINRGRLGLTTQGTRTSRERTTGVKSQV